MVRGLSIAVILLVCSLAGCGESNDEAVPASIDQPGTSTTEATPAGDVAPDDGIPSPELQRGDEGQWVTVLQEELIRHGYALHHDGIFGSVTEDAVRAFQAARGLTVDGIVGPKTWAALVGPGAVTSTMPPPISATESPVPSSGEVLLRGDGLGNVRFGDPMSEVEPWLVRELGAPVWESVARTPLAASQWYEAQDLFRSLTFELGELSTETGHVTGLTVRFSDVSDARNDGVVHLASWSTWNVGTEALNIATGLRIGMTRAELEERFPSVVITPERPGSARFEIVDGDDGAAGLRGELWDERGVASFEAGTRGRDHDDIPAAPPPPDGPIVADLALRADGLGDVEFQGPAVDLVPALTERFGRPAEETNVRARPGVPMRGPLGYFPESEVRLVRWYDPGLTIVVADGRHYGGMDPGDLRLVYWSTSSGRLRLETGVGVGTTLSELIGAYPATTVGYSDECAGAYFPASFYVDTQAGRLDGRVAWDWVSDVQRALNERGATLAVDGEYGPRTRAAVEAFQIEAAIDATASYDGPGEAGPLTLDALGIALPADANVAGLRAGSTGSC